MNILLATEVIQPGGAETFVLRLAAALQKAGNNVRLFIFYKEPFRKELVQQLAPTVPIHFAGIPAGFLLQKMDGFFYRLGVDFSFRKKAIASALGQLLVEHKIEIIHSHLLKTDEVCRLATVSSRIPTVTTIHGDYLQFFEKTKRGVKIPLLHYPSKAKKNLQWLKNIACISDKQIHFFEEIFPKETNGKLRKIYNGYESNAELKMGKRTLLKIPENAFVFGMVSRGIPEKGWERAIQAFENLKNNSCHLILVGDSVHLQTLKKQYADVANIHFTGHSDEPLEWIQTFDAGLLPSTYPSESLPTVVIEYLFCGIPVIASDAGEIRNMIHQQGKKAGIILPLEPEKMKMELTKAMQQYLTDKETFAHHKANASLCFEAFRMDRCITAYTKFYEEAQLKTATA